MISIYDFEHYKTFLQSYLLALPKQGHGERSKIAQALQCQSAYLSQVLKGRAELSTEQTDRLAHYLRLTDEEAEFLFLLVELARAGTQSLKKRLERKKEKILSLRTKIKNRIDFKDSLTIEDQTEYYRSWLYGVVHLMVAIPALQTREKLMQTLKADPAELDRVLEFLMRCGLIEALGGKFKTGRVSLHLGSDSALVKQHHTNWRLRAIESMIHEKKNDLHYSSAVSVAQKDLPAIREILLKAIAEVRKIVKDSIPEDSIYSYAIDLFELYEF